MTVETADSTTDSHVRLTRIASGEYICPPLGAQIQRGRVHAGGSWMTQWHVTRNEVTATFQTLDDVRAWLNGLVQA